MANAATEGLSRTEVYTRYHEAEASLRAERERASEAEAQLELVLGKLQAQLPIYQDKTERLRLALESNESLSGRLAAAVGAERESKREAEKQQLEVQVLRSLTNQLSGEVSTRADDETEPSPRSS